MDKKRVGIVTIISNNYGNRLQNYAMQKALEELNCNVYTIPSKQKSFKQQLKDFVSFVMSFVPNQKMINPRWVLFNYKIQWYKHLVDYDGILDDFDAFIAGSDQIWNPYFHFNSEREFLTFAPYEKRIAYAASIGVEKLPEEKVEEYKNYILDIPFVSLRENEGAQLVYELIGKKVEVVLDPTMLVSREHWIHLAKQAKVKQEKKYILKYFLGEENDAFHQQINKIAKENHLEIVDLYKDPYYYKQCGPIEFINFIRQSEYVFTDSFHATVFSLLFHKKFGVLKRSIHKTTGNMESRIKTLLKNYELEERYIQSIDDFKIIYEDYDDEKVMMILHQRKNESLHFLKNALKIQ